MIITFHNSTATATVTTKGFLLDKNSKHDVHCEADMVVITEMLKTYILTHKEYLLCTVRIQWL